MIGAIRSNANALNWRGRKDAGNGEKMAGESATRRDPGSGGFNLLDASAFVAGAATAAIHFRGVAEQVGPREGWVLLGLTYTWASVTTSGPFIMLARRYGRRVAGYPRAGDWCRTLLGLPWVVAVLMLPDPSLGLIPLKPLFSPRNPLDLGVIAVGVAFASIGAMALTWTTWAKAPPRPQGEAMTWTERVGLILAVAWPIQCGLGLEVIG